VVVTVPNSGVGSETRRRPQAHAYADPTRACEHEVDAEKDSERPQRRHGPMGQDDQPQQQRDHSGHYDPNPGRSVLHVEAKENPHDARSAERRAENQC
jgi:hypothetical protein